MIEADPLWARSGSALAAQLRSGQITAASLRDACIARLDAAASALGIRIAPARTEMLDPDALPCIVLPPVPSLDTLRTVAIGGVSDGYELQALVAAGAAPFGIGAGLRFEGLTCIHHTGGDSPDLAARWVEDLALLAGVTLPEELQVTVLPVPSGDRDSDAVLYKAALALRALGARLVETAGDAEDSLLHLLPRGPLPRSLLDRPHSALRIDSRPGGVQIIAPEGASALSLRAASALQASFGLPGPLSPHTLARAPRSPPLEWLSRYPRGR